MNKLNEDELFRHVNEFLKTKGIQLQEGPYSKGIQKGCELLADTVNVSQMALERARTEMDKHLDQMRQIIHERTAPKSPPPQSEPQAKPWRASPPKAARASTTKTKGRKKR